jgi:hypothetical protein
MWPFIKSGDLVTVVSCKKMPVAGSVAAVFYHDQCIVHRVVKRRERPGIMGEVDMRRFESRVSSEDSTQGDRRDSIIARTKRH